MCIVQCLHHCWPHRGTSLCSCRCGYWLAALRSGDLQTKESFRMCSHCERPCSVIYSRLHTEKQFGLLWGSKKCFCFPLQQLYLAWQHTGLKLQVIQAMPNMKLSLEVFAEECCTRPAFTGGNSLCVAVGGRFPLSVFHAYFRGGEPWEDLQWNKTVPPFSSLPSTQHFGGEGRTERNQNKKKDVTDKIPSLMHGANWFLLNL